VGEDRIVGGQSRRRGVSRAVVLLATALAFTAAGCGKSGEGAQTDPEKGSDAELLNAALAQELKMLDAYTEAMPLLAGAQRAIARRFRGHEQEYVDAITKALRGLGGEAEAERSDFELTPDQRADLLARLYRLEGESLILHLDAVPELYTAAPRTLSASLAAGHAAHRVALRQALGVPAAELVPEAFDSGEEPLPAAGR
jgi:hypothetical protein